MENCKPNKEDTLHGLQEARRAILSHLAERDGLSIKAALSQLEAKFEASDQRASLVYHDKKYTWKYSKKLPNHRVQLDALKLLFVIMDAMPSDKHNVNIDGGLTVEIVRTIIPGEAR